MTHTPIRILLIDDDVGAATLIRTKLSEVDSFVGELDSVSTYVGGLAALIDHSHDVYLLASHLHGRCSVDLLLAARSPASRSRSSCWRTATMTHSMPPRWPPAPMRFSSRTRQPDESWQGPSAMCWHAGAVTNRARLKNAALHAAANSVVITDRDGTIIWGNPAFTRLSGLYSQRGCRPELESVQV